MRYAIAMLTAVTMAVAGGEGQKPEAPRGFMLGDRTSNRTTTSGSRTIWPRASGRRPMS